MRPRITLIFIFCLFAALIANQTAAQQAPAGGGRGRGAAPAQPQAAANVAGLPGGDPCAVSGAEPARGGARGGGGGGAAAPEQQRFPRNVTVSKIPGVIAAGTKWVEVWRG